MCGVKKEIGGPNKPYDAHDADEAGLARIALAEPCTWLLGAFAHVSSTVVALQVGFCTILTYPLICEKLHLWAKTWAACAKKHVSSHC